jgi:hypothetical protein
MLNSILNKDMILMALVALLIGFSLYLYTETRWLKTSLYSIENNLKTEIIEEEPNKEEETEEVNGSGDA